VDHAGDGTPKVTGFYAADKDAITVGRDPRNAAHDVVYAAWDDFSCNTTGDCTTGLPVSRSADGGHTWKTTYADRILSGTTGCSFAQYIGAQPIVDPANGTLYVAAERISLDDPGCTGVPPVTFSQVIFKSIDGGTSFSPAVKIADVSPAGGQGGAIRVGPGQLIRTIEFPTVALRGGSLYVAWNDGASGHSHVKLARSSDGAATWSTSRVTSGGGDEFQPQLSADSAGLHLLFYRREASNRLVVDLSTSATGATWATRQVSSVSFGVPITLPNFDPIIAQAYMGDYLGNVSAGGHLYLAWGDNRNVVHNDLYPSGRLDPDVYFARL